MKNLENLSVQEMNLQELQQVDGGFLPLLALVLYDAACIGFLAGAYYELQQH